MNSALFDMPGRPPGRVRVAFDAQVARINGTGAQLPDDLVILCQSLADRLDELNAGGGRGYVMLAAEYRAARADLLEGISSDVAGPDPFAAALAEFRAAQASDAQGPVPNH